MCRGRVLVRAVLLWLALAATAWAERTEGGLVWRAPPACPDVGEVQARIERRLGAPLESVVHGVEVEIAPDGAGNERRFVARIDLRAVTVANEIRVLTSARCDELTDAVAVVIARVASERRQLAERAERQVAERQVAERREPERIAAHEAPPRLARTWGGGVRALGVSGVGAIPGIGVGGEIAAFVRRRSLFVEVGGARWLPSPRVLYMGASWRVDVGLLVAIARLGWGPERLPLRGWISAELGSIDGQGIPFDDRPVGARWTGVGGGFGVAWPMTRYTRLVGFMEVVAPLQRAQFVLQHGTEVYRPEVATARCGLGLEVGWR